MRETLPYLFEKYLLGVYCLTGYSSCHRGHQAEQAHGPFSLPWERIIHSFNNFSEPHVISLELVANHPQRKRNLRTNPILCIFLNTSNYMMDYQVLLVKLLPGTYMSLKYISNCDLGPICPWKMLLLVQYTHSAPMPGWACGVAESCRQPSGSLCRTWAPKKALIHSRGLLLLCGLPPTLRNCHSLKRKNKTITTTISKLLPLNMSGTAELSMM